MRDIRVAARYAKALVLEAQKDGRLEKLKQDIDDFIKTCNNSRPLIVFLNNPIIAPERKALVLGEMFKNKLDDKLIDAFKLICKKNRESYLYAIAHCVVSEYNRLNNIQEAEIITATEISPKLKAEVIRIVTEITNKKVSLKEKVDKNIIGGYILKIGDKRLDNSLKSQLNRLRNSFSA
ncbi:MAG: ATP synthase F1 subunit delta [Flammeovirgaceae bacterium]